MENFKDISSFIYNLRNVGSSLSVDRMKLFADICGNVQNNYKKVHVAGTNGKGSTCAMLDAVFRYCGYKTGMFTSPHLIHLGERIRVNGVQESEEKLLKYILKLKGCAEKAGKIDPKMYPTFFEFITEAAFLIFNDEKVDVAVTEVGLGGRLDATNIITPEISVITSIGKDHTDYLGDTLEKIAFEKAGIIKPNVPVVCGFIDEKPLAVIKARAKELNAPIYCVADYYKSIEGLPKTSLFGAYQRKNAATASLCCKVLNERGVFKLPQQSVKEALMHVKWAARWQTFKMKNGATVILDSSHNEECAKVLDENLATLSEKPVVVCGVLGKDRAIPLLKVIAKHAKKIIFVRPDQPRALPQNELAALMPPNCRVAYEYAEIKDIFPAKNECSAKLGALAVITGSIYLAGEVLSAITAGEKPSLSDLI